MKTTRKILFQCDKCGKEVEYNPGSYEEEGCWSINLGRAGYGSSLDGSDVNFDICDECLCNFIGTFIHKDRIYNSGSNFYYEDDSFNIDEDVDHV